VSEKTARRTRREAAGVAPKPEEPKPPRTLALDEEKGEALGDALQAHNQLRQQLESATLLSQENEASLIRLMKVLGIKPDEFRGYNPATRIVTLKG
jgi:hypothetical protein